MARIGAEELERLKREVDLAGLVRAHGVDLTQRGDGLVGRCPLGIHDDTTPSFHVTPAKGLFHCFGCGAAGSVVDWVMKTRNVSFRNAVEILRTHGGSGPTEKLKTNRRLVSAFPTDVDDQKALDLVADHYHQQLAQAAAAREYLVNRRIGGQELVDKFRIGVADRTLGYHLAPAALKDGREMRARLQRLGVLRESGHELLRGCVTFPITDDAGHVVGMYGRRIARPPRAGTEKRSVHWYLPGPRRGVFNLVDGIRGQKTVVLCESIIDALTFYGAGIHNVTCAYGVEGFSDEILGALTSNSVKRVQIAFDADDAGDRGAEKVAAKLMALGIECFRVRLPPRMDVNELAQKVTSTNVSLGLLLKSAEWIKPDTIQVQLPVAAALPPPEPKAAVEEDKQLPPTMETPSPSPQKPMPTLQPPPQLELATSQPVADDLDAEEHHFTFGPRKYRVRGLKVNTSLMVMKVNVTVRSGAAFYVDTLDLLTARARAHFIKMASVELGVDEGVVKADVGSLLERLEALQDVRMQKLLEKPADKAPPMTEEEKAAAMRLLKDPQLMERIVDDIEKMGLVGERTNKLLCYVAAVSRKLQKPLAIIIQSRSGGGKSSLMEAVLSLIPDEDVVKYSAMTSQALYYMGETNLCHKILALAEEEGAEKAAYALKLLQSEGELTIASTGKDPQSGRHETKEYHVEGPVMVLVTTTASEIDEEFLNRCLVLTVDESREQTRAIHTAQKNALTREGLVRRNERTFVLNVHKNAQRMLRPLAVENPYGKRLTFPDHEMRTRRDFPKYTSLIEAITLLHQHQREVKEIMTEHGEVLEAVVTTVDDIRMANELVAQVLGQSLDELQAQTRRLLQLIQAMVEEECKADDVKREDFRFTQRLVREKTGWGNTQLKMHLARLVERELLVLHRGGPGLRHFYELCYDEKVTTDGPVMCGLCNPDDLNTIVTGRGLAGGGRGDVAGASAPGATGSNGHDTRRNGVHSGI